MTFTLEPPQEMPPQQVERIANLKCPPPIKPSEQTARLKEQQRKFKEITKDIDLIEEQLNDLEKRFKISFSTKAQPKFDLKMGEYPKIDIDGSVNNIELTLHLHPGRKGLKGLQGEQGDQGSTPLDTSNLFGEIGRPGYYGIRGDSLNNK